MNFIKLTLVNNKNIFINISLATDIYVSTEGTIISFGEHYNLTVKELPNSIFRLAECKINEL